MSGNDSRYDANDDDDSHLKPSSRGSDHERSRTRERERDRDRGGRQRRDYKDRSMRDERVREKYDDYDRHRNRDNDRHRDFDRDKDRRHRHRSRSKDKSRNRSRSVSPSRSPSKSKRRSGFDMAPPVASMLSGAAIPVGSSSYDASPSHDTQQATRHARRVYVGGLPPSANEQVLFSHLLLVLAYSLKERRGLCFQYLPS